MKRVRSRKLSNKRVEDVKNNNDLDKLDYKCLDTAIHIIGDAKEDPNVWVWENKEGKRVTIYDEGNDNCSFIAVIREPVGV